MKRKRPPAPVSSDTARIQRAEARAEQAVIRAEQAETALQFIVSRELELIEEVTPCLPKGSPWVGIDEQRTLLSQLTGRQREVLQFIAMGRNTKQIADILKISPKTVEYHRMRLMATLNLYDVPSLVRFALWVRLLPLENLARDTTLPAAARSPLAAQLP